LHWFCRRARLPPFSGGSERGKLVDWQRRAPCDRPAVPFLIAVSKASGIGIGKFEA
jgi:hypothetical protein